jgi:hypothetical protein
MLLPDEHGARQQATRFSSISDFPDEVGSGIF